MKNKYDITYRFPNGKLMYRSVREYENVKEARDEYRLNGLFCCYITTLDNLLTYRDREYKWIDFSRVSQRRGRKFREAHPEIYKGFNRTEYVQQFMTLRVFEYIQTVFISDLDEGLQDNFVTLYEKMGYIA